MATFRRCRWCKHPLVDAASRAGRLDLLTEPETPAEQTREIPAVQDDVPPDQMT